MLNDKIRPKRRMMADINVVPYIDVMLVLLVVFMVTAPLLTQGIMVELPSANGDPMLAQEEPVVLSVDQQGRYFVNVSETEQELSLSKVGDMVLTVREAAPQTPIFLEGDTSAPYGPIAQLLSHLHAIGITDVGLVTEPVQPSTAAKKT